MKSLILASILLSSLASFASRSTYVTCWVVTSSNTYAKKTSTITLKLNEKGNIIKLSEYFVAQADRKDILFGLFGQSLEDSAVESVRMAKAKNDYSMVILNTTAETIAVGVHKNLKNGFYRYTDNGSGNGDAELSLTCSPGKQSLR